MLWIVYSIKNTVSAIIYDTTYESNSEEKVTKQQWNDKIKLHPFSVILLMNLWNKITIDKNVFHYCWNRQIHLSIRNKIKFTKRII